MRLNLREYSIHWMESCPKPEIICCSLMRPFHLDRDKPTSQIPVQETKKQSSKHVDQVKFQSEPSDNRNADCLVFQAILRSQSRTKLSFTAFCRTLIHSKMVCIGLVSQFMWLALPASVGVGIWTWGPRLLLPAASATRLSVPLRRRHHYLLPQAFLPGVLRTLKAPRGLREDLLRSSRHLPLCHPSYKPSLRHGICAPSARQAYRRHIEWL